MRIDLKQGLIEGVRYCPSPNCDRRPEGMEPELVVVHGISLPPGKFGGDYVEALFTNTLDPNGHPFFAEIAGLEVSAHALIHRDGRVVQYVPFHRRAWHAGVSSFRGRSRCNDFSIGIELEGTDEAPYEPMQYLRLAELIHALTGAYPGLSPDRVVGHCHIAPGRKTDPGPQFDWPGLRALLTGSGAPPDAV